ncbi:MAG: hypothetical protein AB7S36_08130, partial [Planctomycetota bacterium]
EPAQPDRPNRARPIRAAELNGHMQRPQSRLLAFSLCVLLIGVVLYLVGDQLAQPRSDERALTAIIVDALRNVGGVLIATAVLSVGWEWFGKRELLAKYTENIRLLTEVERAGLIHVYRSWKEVRGWDDWLHAVGGRGVELLGIHFHDWIDKHEDEIRQAATDGIVRAFLPDTKDPGVIATLDTRFGGKVAKHQAELVDQTIERLETIAKQCKPRSDRRRRESEISGVQVFLIKQVPTHTLYRLGSNYVLTIYNHQMKSTAVPAFVFDGAGSVAGTLHDDLKALARPELGTRHRFKAPDTESEPASSEVEDDHGRAG